MRLDSDIIAWLKADGRGYQTKANWLLRHAMLHFSKERSLAQHVVTTAGVGKTKRHKTRARLA